MKAKELHGKCSACDEFGVVIPMVGVLSDGTIVIMICCEKCQAPAAIMGYMYTYGLALDKQDTEGKFGDLPEVKL